MLFLRVKQKIKKYLDIDGNKSSLSEIFKDINFVWLTPQMDKIMYEGDSIKRKFLDKIISNYNFDYKKDDTILFGRESAGVPDFVHEIANARLKIPISKNTRSLNVVTSISIVLSEALRQNNYYNI